LRWWLRLLITLAASVVELVVLIFGAGLGEPLHYQGTYFQNYVMGMIFIVYGLVVAITALW
jgi:hypothetical protein